METWTIEGPLFSFLQPAVQPMPVRLCLRSRSRSEAEALLARLPEKGLGVVGTRHPSRRSQQEVHRVLKAVSPKNGWTVVSGLAFGLDAEAHEAALKFGFPTLAVLASPVDRIYPAAHHALAERILASGGILLSEKPVGGEKPHKSDFLARNRLIAGLSKAVWIVEAGDPSGALSTAHWALNMGVDVYASPFHPTDASGAGNRRILEQAQAYPLWNAESFRSTWLAMQTGSLALKAPSDPQLQKLWKILRNAHQRRGALTWDELLLLWGGSTPELNDLVFQLENQGQLKVEGGWLVFQGQVR
jgi:DNA processing protein